jgi:hypothetical protein
MEGADMATDSPTGKMEVGKRITLNLSPEAAERLKDLARSNRVSMGEVIRRSLSLESFVQNEVRKGAKILVQEKDGTMKELVLR